jgi:hypothetical protein
MCGQVRRDPVDRATTGGRVSCLEPRGRIAASIIPRQPPYTANNGRRSRGGHSPTIPIVRRSCCILVSGRLRQIAANAICSVKRVKDDTEVPMNTRERNRQAVRLCVLRGTAGYLRSAAEGSRRFRARLRRPPPARPLVRVGGQASPAATRRAISVELRCRPPVIGANRTSCPRRRATRYRRVQRNSSCAPR